jgi:hypothetical protein
LTYMRLWQRLPARKENIFFGRVITGLRNRTIVGIVLPGKAGSHG